MRYLNAGLLMLVIFFSDNSIAGVIAIGKGTVDWSTANISLPAGASYISYYSSSEAVATYYPSPLSSGIKDPMPGFSTIDTANSWGDTDFLASLVGGNVKGSGVTSSSKVESSGFISLVGEGQAGESGSLTKRDGTVFLLNSGTVSVSVDFTYSLSLSTTNQGEVAEGFVDVILALAGSNDLANLEDIDIAGVPPTMVVSNGQTYKKVPTTIRLSVSGNFDAGETVKFGIDNAVYVRGVVPERDDNGHSVPEPPSFILLALGLACLGWSRRSHSGRHNSG